MWPLETLDRAIYAWHQRRDRGLHRELARLEAAEPGVEATAAQILRDAHQRLAPLYDTAPHPTA